VNPCFPCATREVANLLLARGTIRRRHPLGESLLLALAGAILGLGLGYLGVRALLAINPGGIPRIGENGAAVPLDWGCWPSRFSQQCSPVFYSASLPRLSLRAQISATHCEKAAHAQAAARDTTVLAPY
jgi:hypothetical protein